GIVLRLLDLEVFEHEAVLARLLFLAFQFLDDAVQVLGAPLGLLREPACRPQPQGRSRCKDPESPPAHAAFPRGEYGYDTTRAGQLPVAKRKGPSQGKVTPLRARRGRICRRASGTGPR